MTARHYKIVDVILTVFALNFMMWAVIDFFSGHGVSGSLTLAMLCWTLSEIYALRVRLDLTD